MHIGIQLPLWLSLRDILKSVPEIPEGIDSIWASDVETWNDPFVTLTAIVRELAIHGRELIVGTSLVTPVLLHPIGIARAATSLATLNNRKVIIGIGAADPSRRLRFWKEKGEGQAILEQTIQIIQDYVYGREIQTNSGPFRAKLNGTSTQMPHLTARPQIMAGASTIRTFKRALRLTGNNGGVLANFASPEFVRTGIMESARVLEKQEVFVHLPYVAEIRDDDQGSMQKIWHLVNRRLALYVSSMSRKVIELHSSLTMLLTENIKQLVHAGQIDKAARHVTDDMRSEFVAQGVDELKEKMRKLSAVGATGIIIDTVSDTNSHFHLALQSLSELF